MSCFNKVCQPYRVKARNGKLLSNDKTIVLRFAFEIHVVVKRSRASDEAQEDKGFNFSN